jgi:hypothetical protein
MFGPLDVTSATINPDRAGWVLPLPADVMPLPGAPVLLITAPGAEPVDGRVSGLDFGRELIYVEREPALTR